ncbi:uncharacterized protein LDX57_009007 [Aspergillus melleus]|uniref:uncharacterized protein n=1 Tax=Aspergillus melleus TaxID=138277 RepID=UPI001E8E0207|nr:uncharacterized protein LDX57_009007 [Aspergillus melleus]KAH8431349.1 hypothetical protein LDX57_009007 [Aspergillus melleus]
MDYRWHLRDVHHYQKSICEPPGKTCKKRSSSALDESPTSDKKQFKKVERPCKRQKAGSKSSRSVKGHTFINWEPHATRLRARRPAQARKEDQGHQCPSINLHAVSQDGHSARSASLDLPGLTDDTSTCASYSAASPTIDAIPIDPQILQPAPWLVYQPVQGDGQDRMCGSVEYRDSHCANEPAESNVSHQTPLENPTQRDIDCEEAAYLGADNITTDPTTPSTPLSRPDAAPTTYESRPANDSFHMVQQSTDIATIQNEGKAVNFIGPITRVRTRAMTRSCQRSTGLRTSSGKARAYSQEEDALLKSLMEEWGTLELVVPRFQKSFPNRSAISLQKRWLLIRSSPRRSTRSRPI